MDVIITKKREELNSKDYFWVMFYFLEEHHSLSGGQFDVSDILSASEPFDESYIPADSSMLEYWNEAIEKYIKNGPPDFKCSI